MADKVFSFTDLKKSVDKESTLGTADDVFFSKYSFVNSGNYMLNALLSAQLLGGYPEGRIVSINGEKGCLHPNEIIEIYEFKTLGYTHNIIDEFSI